jgi:CRP-like cAMP-binding protein
MFEPTGAKAEGQVPGWVATLVEVLLPVSLRAHQLGSMALFDGFRWSELEVIAGLFEEVEIPRGSRLTVQGRPGSRLWLIVEGEALASADARPLRVAGHGDAVDSAAMLYGVRSPETTIALSPIRALAAGPEQFRALVGRAPVRRRLIAVAGGQLRSRRNSKLR